jgi:hypothetical protein
VTEARKYQAVKRRSFITLLGSSAAWPHVARAQQREAHRLSATRAAAVIAEVACG